MSAKHIFTPTSLTRLTHNKIVSRLAAHKHKHVMRNYSKRPIVPSLSAILSSPRVPNRINHTVYTPHRAQDGRCDGVPQSGNQHGTEGCNVVLVEVLVRALGRVEG